MHDKNIRKVVLICGVLFAGILMLPYLGGTDMTGDKKEDEIEVLLCSIDGVEEVNVVYYYTDEKNSEVLDGVAIVYKGREDSRIREQIYELINALYDIPYNRIYVSH